MDVLSPRSLGEALRLKAEHPDAVPISGGTDLMVELNFDRRRPDRILNLGEVGELRGWSRADGLLRLGAGLTYAEAMDEPLGSLLPALAEASRTVGSRLVGLDAFLVGPKRNALEADELIVAVLVRPSGAPQTFMKVGPRNAMVIAVCSLAVAVDRERGELRAAFGSAGPVPLLVIAPLAEAGGFPALVASAATPIDDVRGTAAYRRHALRV